MIEAKPAVVAGEYVKEHDMFVAATSDNGVGKTEDGRTRAVIFSTTPFLRNHDGRSMILHSQHYFLGLPAFDTEIIGVPWSSEKVLEDAMRTSDIKLLDHMVNSYGWRIAVLLHDDLYIDGRINDSPDAINQLALFDLDRKANNPSLKEQEVLQYLAV